MRMRLIWQMCGMVVLWWAANTLCDIAAEYEIVGDGNTDITQRTVISLTAAFKDLRWLDLTAAQHMTGIVLSVIGLKCVLGKTLWPKDVCNVMIWMAVFCHVFGSLVTNAALSLGNFTPLEYFIRTCEPVVTFAFTFYYYKHSKQLRLFSLIVMILGAMCTFVVFDSSMSINLWSLMAVTISTIVFPMRNISLKEASDSWEGPLQVFMLMSVSGICTLLPFLCLKKNIVGRNLFNIFRADNFIVSGLTDTVYNVASLGVLQNVTPLTHAVLNLSKRVLVNVAFEHPTFSLSVSIGSLLFAIGLMLYFSRTSVSHKSMLLASLFVVVYLYFIPFPNHSNFHMQAYRYHYSPSSNSHQDMFTSWMFDNQIPPVVIANIHNLRHQKPAPCNHIHVFCGTTQCVRAVADFKDKQVTTEFLVITNVFKQTSLEKWFAQHLLYKIVAGANFELHLQEAVKLGILWEYGGTYVDPMLKLSPKFQFPTHRHAWVSVMTSGGDARRMLDIAFFPEQHHPFIGALIEQFVSEYSKEALKDGSFQFDFQEVVQNTYASFCHNSNQTCPMNVPLQIDEVLSLENSFKDHYGTFLYDSTGPEDESQGISGIQFLPFVDRFLKRDKLKASRDSHKITTFFDGSWKSRDIDWPPPENINPIMLSLRIEPSFLGRNVHYFKEKGPIGCHDHSTLKLLRNHGVESYFSGSMALLMKRFDSSRRQTNNVYMVDVKPKFGKLFPREVKTQDITLQRVTSGSKHFNFVEAYKLIEKFTSAKVVITQSIHYALVCVAMGTPVVFINSPELTAPALVGGSEYDYLLSSGLTSLFHTVDLYNASIEEANHWLHEFPWDNPPPNPNIAMMMRLRATLWNVIRNNQQLYDASYKFGIIPFSIPVPKSKRENQLVFYLLFTTSRDSIFKYRFGLFSRVYISGFFNWRHMRSIESIFHHHPLAKVVIYSNTLDQSEFDMLTEAGYDIKVQRYNLEQMLENSPAQNFTDKLEDARKGIFWYSHETDLIRMLILYESGGVYMDTDVIIVRPIDSLGRNVIGWEDDRKLNGAFLKFERQHPFVKACLEEFAANYAGHIWAGNGPDIITRVWRRLYRRNDEVRILRRTAFYMFHWRDVKPQCFDRTDQQLFDENMKTLNEEAYAVHLNSKLTAIEGMRSKKLKDGSICKNLLNSHCVLCNHQY